MIDGYDAIHALRTVVARAGRQFVYNRAGSKCSYVKNGCADCGVAQALVELGMSITQLAEWDKLDSSGIGNVPFEATLGAKAVFWAFQRRQDHGMNWGDCLDVAEVAHRAMASYDKLDGIMACTHVE